MPLVMFLLAKSIDMFIQDPKGSVRSQMRREGERKRREGKGKPKGKLVSLAACCEVLQGNQVSSSIFQGEPLRFYVSKSFFYVLVCLS